ncbi:MAG: glycosyltransferase family 2 protein [Candidatus Omnitrophica bacterium]|nr:glycosyltransferase family 2 protein [Candidatus Omnitrophota bacterium]
MNASPAPPDRPRVSVLIPAQNEEKSIGLVIQEIPKDWVDEIIVADNASTDRTAEVAQEAGARVVHESTPGYGAACLAAMKAMNRPDIVVFLDGDHSDYPEDLPKLLAPILENRADLVIGSRALGLAEKGSLTPQQRYGNALATRLIRWFFGVSFTDLGPFRAVRAETLKRIGMVDRNYGWTVEMQVKAARLGVRCTEIPVRYRKRIGVSKISGTVSGTVKAGTKILWTIFKYSILPAGAPAQPSNATLPERSQTENRA